MAAEQNIQDNLLKTTKAMPAANANNNHDGIDLGASAPGVSIQGSELVLAVPALPSLADGKTATFKVQDSADNVTFADVEELASRTRLGAGGAGSAAATFRWKLPLTLNRYIRINQAVEAVGGDNTAVTTTVTLRH